MPRAATHSPGPPPRPSPSSPLHSRPVVPHLPSPSVLRIPRTPPRPGPARRLCPPWSNCSSAPRTPLPPAGAQPLLQIRPGPRPSAPPCGPIPRRIQGSPSSRPLMSCPAPPVPLTLLRSCRVPVVRRPLLGPTQPPPPLGPTSGAVRPSLFPLAPPQAPSGPRCPLGPGRAAPQPIQRSPCPGPRPAAAPLRPGQHPPRAPTPELPSSGFRTIAGHSLLLEQHHVASRLGGGCLLPARLPARFPAAALPVALPGPAACASSSWSVSSPPLSPRTLRRLLRPGLTTSRAAADAARSSGSAAPRGGGASLRQPARHTQRAR